MKLYWAQLQLRTGFWQTLGLCLCFSAVTFSRKRWVIDNLSQDVGNRLKSCWIHPLLPSSEVWLPLHLMTLIQGSYATSWGCAYCSSWVPRSDWPEEQMVYSVVVSGLLVVSDFIVRIIEALSTTDYEHLKIGFFKPFVTVVSWIERLLFQLFSSMMALILPRWCFYYSILSSFKLTFKIVFIALVSPLAHFLSWKWRMHWVDRAFFTCTSYILIIDGVELEAHVNTLTWSSCWSAGAFKDIRRRRTS